MDELMNGICKIGAEIKFGEDDGVDDLLEVLGPVVAMLVQSALLKWRDAGRPVFTAKAERKDGQISLEVSMADLVKLRELSEAG